MARYRGPKTKIARKFGEAIYGYDKSFEKRSYPPGQHGPNKRRKSSKSDYGIQLKEKQKAKYTYGVLERQFRNLFAKASSKKGVTGEVLFQLLEARLDNVIYRMGMAPTRRAARQLVSHKHVVLNGVVTNVPSTSIRPGDIVGIRGKSQGLEIVVNAVSSKSDVRNFGWLEFNQDKMEGKFLEYPERAAIPEKINEQLIVELYSK